MKLGAICQKFLPLISGLLLIIFVSIFFKELNNYSYREIVNNLKNISQPKLYIAILLTIIGYSVIAHYDKVAFASANYQLKNSKILTTAFISYAICNNLGFTLLLGGSIRYYFYNYYRVPQNVIFKAIAFSNLNFWLGLCGLGGIVFLVNPLTIPHVLQSNFVTVRPLGLFFLLGIGIYLYLSWQNSSITVKGKTLIIPSLSISVAQIIVSALDWAIASAVLYVLLPSQLAISYGDFVGIYLLGIAARVISNIPGGLGVFETVIITCLPAEITKTDCLSSLLAYRGIYFLFPLFVSLFLLGFCEIKKRYQKIK